MKEINIHELSDNDDAYYRVAVLGQNMEFD